MSKHIKSNVYSVGKIDWDLRSFHGGELSTHHGSTYNSYLIKEKKTVLIDSVWEPFASEFMHELPHDVDIQKIDAIVVLHAEIDHSGAMLKLMEKLPNVPVYCTPNGVKSLKGHFHKDWNFKPVRTGDRLDIGNGKELVFIEAAMLHWPDTMFAYLTGDNILFTNDAFGQHLATDMIWADLVDERTLKDELIKYYANIIAPWGKLVDAKIREIQKMNLPLDMILTSHGACWRKGIPELLSTYLSWANAYKENRITIMYDTIWGGTRIMADSIARGIREVDNDVVVSVFNLSNADKNDVATEVFRSKALLVGSPSHNKCLLTPVAGVLEELRGLAFKGKKAAAFGCYGWSGEAQKRLNEIVRDADYELVDEGITNLWEPGEEAVQKCVEYGRQFAVKCR